MSTIGPLNLKHEHVRLDLLLTVINIITYVANRIIMWHFFTNIKFIFIKKKKNRFYKYYAL